MANSNQSHHGHRNVRVRCRTVQGDKSANACQRWQRRIHECYALRRLQQASYCIRPLPLLQLQQVAQPWNAVLPPQPLLNVPAGRVLRLLIELGKLLRISTLLRVLLRSLQLLLKDLL
jgi:hypothetical protein